MNAYYKIQEQKKKSDKLILEALITRRWGGQLPACATRIEFQVCRPWLPHHGVDSPADLLRLQGSIISHLMQWFRITTTPIDRKNKNQARAKTHPLWVWLTESFLECYGDSSEELTPLDRAAVRPLMLIKQARGCLASGLLQRGVRAGSYDEFVHEAAKLLYETGDDKKDAERDQRQFVFDYQCRGSEHFAA